MQNYEKKDTKYFLAFLKISGIGPLNIQKMLKYFPNLENAWKGNYIDLVSAGISENLAKEIINQKNTINPDEEINKLFKEEVHALTITDNEYPEDLKQIYSPPPVLFYKGDLQCLNNNCLAVVGARKNTHYGVSVLEKIIPELVLNGLTIISGLALGIDGIAHRVCLQNNGKTVAVLGSGLDNANIYPSTNKQLAEKIIEGGGCLLSESAPGTRPSKQSFPLRNRIISGLSLAVLIIEAGESSGSLITAKYALEQNRDIYAIPGNIFSAFSKGTNNLIKQGAKLINCSQDILDELQIQNITQNEQINSELQVSIEEKEILKHLSHDSIHIDKLSQLCRIKINALSGILSIMEIKGLLKDVGGKNFIKN